ncbi:MULTISPECIES: periplasmic heavy metal sensor [unclassified Caballeronia]|uniref:periplasmic heavy metal sensor n=1 Tax=unclassified Caballeronia TaxID=2646786 RepID=UPI002862F0E1|nr:MULTISPECIES: periplasmic heavy metal sensor [unclassified Caballeronia]MDR5818377.1 periplasmic heavy metal sensor [Caballeronia sp. LZ033]MDR5883220.1 periplasmic heavy metal sensor [Caballeronia sp. LZ032]
MSSRALKALTGVSIVLNVFLLGLLAGGVYYLSGPLKEQFCKPAAAPRGIGFAAADLSPDRRKQLRQALREMRLANQPLIRESREGRIEIAHILAAPTFDRQALDNALARTRQADVTMRALTEGTVAAFASTLTFDERLKLVGAMERNGPLRAVPPEDRPQLQPQPQPPRQP